MQVIPRNYVCDYKNQEYNPREIMEKTGVSTPPRTNKSHNTILTGIFNITINFCTFNLKKKSLLQGH